MFRSNSQPGMFLDLSWNEGQPTFRCKKETIVNGVAKKSGYLRGGERFILKNYRLTLVSWGKESQALTLRANISNSRLLAFGILLLVLTTALSIQKVSTVNQIEEAVTISEQSFEMPAGPPVEPRDDSIESPINGLEVPHEKASPVESPNRSLASSRQREEPLNAKARRKIAQRKASLRRTRIRLEEEPSPRVIAPGHALPDEKVDVLFIHAHPDDESIDFGGLLARCEERGLSTAVLLLTDGEAGLDRIHDRNLEGEELAAVRIEEAAEALSVLGVDIYIRLGLRNHPYNGLSDEMALSELFEEWQESGNAVEKITRLIHDLSPKLLVSPDGPSEAKEHFEHEGTGELVRLALDKLAEEGEDLPAAHLLVIDYRQQELYPEEHKILLPLWDDEEGGAEGAEEAEEAAETEWAAGAAGETLALKKGAALLQHRSQYDASALAFARLPEQEHEYYLPSYWNLDAGFEELFLE